MSEREGASKINEAVVVSMYPDVCVKDGKPVPYDLHGLASDDIRHSPNVNYTGNPTLNEGSRLSTSYGDEPASAGVSSGVVKGMCRPVEGFASKVNVNGLPAVRHDTVFEMNTAGPDGASNTKGKLVYVRDQSEVPDDEAEKKRKATLEKLKEKYGQKDFYNQLAEYDPANADKWNEMARIQQGFADAEPGYDAATRAYSESMRETLHQSTINMFEDPAALNGVTSNGSDGLYDWYIRMHGTAFRENGAWNSDFLTRGMGVMTNTDPAMIWNANRLRKGMGEEDEKAKRAAEQVRARRAAQGLRVSRKPGEELPETKENREQYEREMQNANPWVYTFGA